jgi:hypothetical protein
MEERRRTKAQERRWNRKAREGRKTRTRKRRAEEGQMKWNDKTEEKNNKDEEGRKSGRKRKVG